MKLIILLSTFIAIGTIIIIGEQLYKAYIAIQNSELKKYTAYYRKPSESAYMSFYRTIEAHSKREVMQILYKLENGCYITEVEKC